jgi:hypothetical protein
MLQAGAAEANRAKTIHGLENLFNGYHAGLLDSWFVGAGACGQGLKLVEYKDQRRKGRPRRELLLRPINRRRYSAESLSAGGPWPGLGRRDHGHFTF